MSIRQGGKVIAGNVSHYNIGDTFMTKRTDTSLAGAVECDGATYNTTDFTGAQSIGALLEAGKLDYVSLSAYSTAISTKGWCDKIGWNGTGNTQFRVPTLNAYIVQTNNIPVVGNGKTLGMTNGTNDLSFIDNPTSQSTYNNLGSYNATVGSSGSSGTYNGKRIGVSTDSTKSGIIADTTDTAQLRVMIQIANGATDEALETCTGVLADVATLKGYDYVVDFQAPTAANNYTWYRKYKSGWVEQGSAKTKPDSNAVSVTLPITMQDSNYSVQVCDELNSSMNTPVCIGSKTTTGFSIYQNNGTSVVCRWQVSGMAAQNP